MPETFRDRFKSAWNVFFNKDPVPTYREIGPSYYYRPDRNRLTRGNDKTIIAAVYNRIALDVSSISIQHVRLDESGRYLETIDDELNNCFNLEANIDQTGRAFIHDTAMSMFDEGCVAMVPIETSMNPRTGAYKIKTMRTGRIVGWFPKHVRVEVFNEYRGQKEEVLVPKRFVAIIENPFYAVMNEHNSTVKRLLRKMALLDIVDEEMSSGKLNMIIQLPYIVKTELKKQQAENRRRDLEQQLSSSKYGIAYIDGTEKVTQINRPLENNLLAQIEYLNKLLLSQLGITNEILDNTADEKTMLNYYSRIVEPILSAIVDEAKRKFLTATARAQLQSFLFFRDPFKLVPISNMAELADKLTRNEILTSNEVRQIIGMKPSTDPEADKLKNKNLKQDGPSNEQMVENIPPQEINPEEEEIQNG